MRRTPASRSRDVVDVAALAVAVEARAIAHEVSTLDPILGDDSAQLAADGFAEQAVASLSRLAILAEGRP